MGGEGEGRGKRQLYASDLKSPRTKVIIQVGKSLIKVLIDIGSVPYFAGKKINFLRQSEFFLS